MAKFSRLAVHLTPLQMDWLRRQAARLRDDTSALLRLIIDRHMHTESVTDPGIGHTDEGRLFVVQPDGRAWFNWGLLEQEAQRATPFQFWAQAMLALRDGKVDIPRDQWTPGTRAQMATNRLAAIVRDAAQDKPKPPTRTKQS